MIRSRVVRYILGAGAAALALALRLALNPLLGEGSYLYPTMLGAVAAVGLLAGAGPALLSLALGTIGLWYFLLPPAYGWTLRLPDAAGLALYLGTGVVFALIGGSTRRARQRADHSARATRAREAQLASMFNVSNVGMTEADPITRRLLRVNRALAAMTGYTERELLAMTIDDLTHPDDRERDLELYGRLARGESAYEMEKRYLAKDGRTLWVEVNGNLVRDEEGRPVRAFAVIKDVTARRKAEASHAEAIARLDAFVRHAPIGFALFDSDLRFIALNDHVATLNGIPVEAHLGRTMSELLPRIGPRVEAWLRRVRQRGRPELDIELAGETPAAPGVERHFRTNLFPVGDAAGRVIGVGATVRDVTERVQAARALRESEQRFATMADSVRTMIWVTDARGEVEFVNRAYREFFGLPEERLKGPGGWNQLVHPDDLPPASARFETALRERTEFSTECRVRHGDGTWRWIMSHASPRFAPDGTFLGHVGSSTDITARKRIEEELARKEAHLELLSDSVPALISYIGRDLCYHSCNRAYTTMLGLSRERIVGRPVREVTGEEVWAIVGPRLETALAGETVEYQAQSRFPDGRLRWIHAVYTPHRDEAGEVRGVIAMTTDITGAKEAELALRSSEERFRTFMEHSPARAWLKDDGGRYVFANRAAVTPLGRTPGQVIGRTDADLFPAPQAEQHRLTDREVLRNGSPLEVTDRLPEPDGDHHFLTVKFRVLDAGGRAHVGGMALDVTRQKRAEQALAESERRFRTMAEVSPVPIWVTDAEGRLEFVNRAYREFFGMTDAQVRDPGAWEALVHPDDAPAYVEPFLAAVRGHTAFAGECRTRHADGSWRWIASHAAPRFSQQGEFLGHVSSSTEITQLKRAEQTLKEADRRKDEFLAILAHELRNPLAPIRTGLELLRVAPDKLAALEHIRPTMERQVEQMVHLIDDLLDVSRIAAGRIRLERQPTPLAVVVDQAVEANRAAIEAAGLHLSVRLPDEPCVIGLDPVRFVQVLSNLLHNATKFTDSGGRIEISAAVHGDGAGRRVALTIRDTGIGIPAATLPHVFDLFAQGDSGERGRAGLGIGLALARRLVELHGGRIEASSEGEGRGTAFTISMPVVSGAVAADRMETPGHATPRDSRQASA